MTIQEMPDDSQPETYEQLRSDIWDDETPADITYKLNAMMAMDAPYTFDCLCCDLFGREEEKQASSRTDVELYADLLFQTAVIRCLVQHVHLVEPDKAAAALDIAHFFAETLNFTQELARVNEKRQALTDQLPEPPFDTEQSLAASKARQAANSMMDTFRLYAPEAETPALCTQCSAAAMNVIEPALKCEPRTAIYYLNIVRQFANYQMLDSVQYTAEVYLDHFMPKGLVVPEEPDIGERPIPVPNAKTYFM